MKINLMWGNLGEGFCQNHCTYMENIQSTYYFHIFIIWKRTFCSASWTLLSIFIFPIIMANWLFYLVYYFIFYYLFLRKLGSSLKMWMILLSVVKEEFNGIECHPRDLLYRDSPTLDRNPRPLSKPFMLEDEEAEPVKIFKQQKSRSQPQSVFHTIQRLSRLFTVSINEDPTHPRYHSSADG